MSDGHNQDIARDGSRPRYCYCLVIKEIAEFGHQPFRLLFSDKVTGIFDYDIADNVAGKGFNESSLRRSKRELARNGKDRNSEFSRRNQGPHAVRPTVHRAVKLALDRIRPGRFIASAYG